MSTDKNLCDFNHVKGMPCDVYFTLVMLQRLLELNDYPLLYIFSCQVVDTEAINSLSNTLSMYLLLNL